MKPTGSRLGILNAGGDFVFPENAVLVDVGTGSNGAACIKQLHLPNQVIFSLAIWGIKNSCPNENFFAVGESGSVTRRKGVMLLKLLPC